METNNVEGSAPSHTIAALNVVFAVMFSGSKYSRLFSDGVVPSTSYLIGHVLLMEVIATSAEPPVNTPPVDSVVQDDDADDVLAAAPAAPARPAAVAHCTRTSWYKFHSLDSWMSGKLFWCSN